MKLSILCISLLLGSTFKSDGANTHASSVSVVVHEVYELANIIIAITDYGKSDPNEVEKETAYYSEVMGHFNSFSDHPLIQKVNYSREAWDKLLSFRTDSYAFTFDDSNRIIRINDFHSMGNEIRQFDDHLMLIEDFAEKTHFREFYAQHTSFYRSIQRQYESSLMLPEVLDFLTTEFRIRLNPLYAIVISPLVGRMHCQRSVDGVSTSFISIPYYVYDSTDIHEIDRSELASGIHMFFTEIDHDFVNAATKKYSRLCRRHFIPSKWDNGSGYAEYRNASFNEYMTWAVYDLFVYRYFPEVAPGVTDEWHEINESRGFFASKHFAAKLHELYNQSQPGGRIVDLYPVLLAWCHEVQDHPNK